mgnify:FL=1
MSAVLTKPKERPILFSGPMVRAILEGRKTVTRRVVTEKQIAKCPGMNYFKDELLQFSPYGRQKDVLWVRETWCDDDYRFWYRADADEAGAVPYEVNGVGLGGGVGHFKPDKWRPSIFMPYAACRLKLRITDVRVERLQKISVNQCLAEGIYTERVGEGWPDYQNGGLGLSLQDSFRTLWDSINKKRGYGWDTNPWVWTVDFERIDDEAMPRAA